MHNINQIIEKFRLGRFDADCNNMTLSQCKIGGESFNGKGYIRQDENEVLIFKIYVTNHNSKPFSNLTGLLGNECGKLLQEECFYKLEATDIHGMQWKVEGVLPSFDWDATDMTVIVKGCIHSMVVRLDIPDTSPYLCLYFFEEYKIPLHLMSETEKFGNKYYELDRAEFEACESKFDIKQQKDFGGTIIEVTSSKDFPESFDLRIQESFQYITAKSAFWRVRVQINQNKLQLDLLSPRKKSEGTQLNPPIHPYSAEFREYGWILFTAYLNYVTKNTKGTYWNPLAYHLYNACEATATSLESSAVGISVAVEAISNLIDLAENQHKKQEITEFQSRINAWLKEQSNLPEDIVRRVEGTIAAMTQKRPQDTLYELADDNKIQKEYIKSWSKIRNKHVHPKPKDLKIPTSRDTQLLIDELNKVQVILRQLTFFIIKYEGKFTDYGKYNFPSEQYPLNSPVTSTTENV